MNTKVLLGTLVGGIVYFGLGGLVYGFLLADTFTPPEGVAKATMEWWAMGLSCLIWAFLLTVVCSRWTAVKTFGSGAIVGAIVGALVSASVDFGMFSMYSFMTIKGSLLDIVVNCALSAITGGIIGWILGTGSRS